MSNEVKNEVKGVISGINGPVVTGTNMTAFQMREMVMVGKKKLIGEVIVLDGDIGTIQVYEETEGLMPGEEILSTADLKNIMWDDGLKYDTLTKMGGGQYGYNVLGGANGEKDKSDPMDTDIGHGTHCAGIIGAQWNNDAQAGGDSVAAAAFCRPSVSHLPATVWAEHGRRMLPS